MFPVRRRLFQSNYYSQSNSKTELNNVRYKHKNVIIQIWVDFNIMVSSVRRNLCCFKIRHHHFFFIDFFYRVVSS
jgi:hypothetical protein